MAQATSISLTKFTETVQRAVKAAVEKHPKFRMDQPTKLSISYLIRGIPVPDVIAANVSVRETQAFANELASQIGAGGFGDEAAAAAFLDGTVYARGRHLIIGIPAIAEVLIEK
jgi:hypothetical protein